MKTSAHGSAVLLIMMIMGMLTAFLLAAVHEGTFLRMFIGKQITVERYKSMGHGLLSYGIRQAKNNYAQLIELHETEIEIPLEATLGRINFTQVPEGIIIASTLLQGQQVIFSASCRLFQNTDKQFIVRGFQSSAFAL